MNKIALLGELNYRYCSSVVPHPTVVDYLKDPHVLTTDESKVFDDACRLMNEADAVKVLDFVNHVSVMTTSAFGGDPDSESTFECIRLCSYLTRDEIKVARCVITKLEGNDGSDKPLFEDVEVQP